MGKRLIIPITILLLGGALADRFNRKRLLMMTAAGSLVGALFLTTACAGSRKPQNKSNLRAEAKEHEMLDKSAQLYWEAVRWGDGERAAMRSRRQFI